MKAERILEQFASSLRRFDEALALEVYESLQEFRQPFRHLYRNLHAAYQDA
jgi:hypothetical protein